MEENKVELVINDNDAKDEVRKAVDLLKKVSTSNKNAKESLSQ